MADIPPRNAPKAILSDLIAYNADKYSVPQTVLKKVIHCESLNDPKAVGDHGTSFGLVQIHLSAHPEIKKEEALDAEFSVNYLAKSLSTGKGKQWTCYKMLKDL